MIFLSHHANRRDLLAVADSVRVALMSVIMQRSERFAPKLAHYRTGADELVGVYSTLLVLSLQHYDPERDILYPGCHDNI